MYSIVFVFFFNILTYVFVKGESLMQVILFNTSNGSAFEMQFSNAKQMKNYLETNAEVEFLSDANSYLPTRHQRMQQLG
jgi:hypothetical protein